MKKALLFSIVIVFLIACGGVKKTQEAINTGNYNSAINKALKNLADNKTKKGHQPYILLLEEAFEKNMIQELERISFLQKDGNPANLENIYNGYNNLKSIQERIKPILPLPIYDENRNAKFAFKDYSNKIISSKNELSDYLYQNGLTLLDNAVQKYDFRKAYEDFKYLNEINPGYADSKQKMEEAYTKGLDFVKVDMVNDTEQIVPERLQEELLNFNTYGLDNLWTEYHTSPLSEIKYDYEMKVAFREINISPEHIKEIQIIKEKQVKDGFSYALDNNGNVVKDSLGNDIKIDKFKTIRCDFYQFEQTKSAQVVGQVSFIDLKSKQQINSYPLSSEFIFEHIYAQHDGDKRALENNQLSLLNLAQVPFPSNEQMVYDAGEDLKLRLKEIVKRHHFN
ncbi:hypothetical protein GGR42_000043 [Saonia flava]|uniref:Lipoprotein n=1 Tax=Saonia flava TaxID=523696 RepID=A0A846QNB3_9FLAO|nr:hypothetical protein [Saonia flava]NJB69581.1 hypothetical protein [Saonia flava]